MTRALAAEFNIVIEALFDKQLIDLLMQIHQRSVARLVVTRTQHIVLYTDQNGRGGVCIYSKYSLNTL